MVVIWILLAISLALNVVALVGQRNMVRSKRNGKQVILKDRSGIIKTGIIRDEN